MYRFSYMYIHFPLKTHTTTTTAIAVAATTRKKNSELTTIRYVCMCVGFFPYLVFLVVVYTHSNFFGCFHFFVAFCFSVLDVLSPSQHNILPVGFSGSNLHEQKKQLYTVYSISYVAEKR